MEKFDWSNLMLIVITASLGFYFGMITTKTEIIMSKIEQRQVAIEVDDAPNIIYSCEIKK